MASDADTTEVERAVLEAAGHWLAGTMSADAEALDRVLAPEYTYTHASNARVDSREEWLESFRSGGRRYLIYELPEVEFRTFPGVVILSGRAHQEMNPRGETTHLNTRFTSVWVERDGEWRCATWQATRLPDA